MAGIRRRSDPAEAGGPAYAGPPRRRYPSVTVSLRLKPDLSASPLRRREFRLYFIGNLTSNVGSWISNVAFAVYIHDLTGSSFWVGMVGLSLFVPTLLFALPAGALADRFDRLRLLRSAQILMATLAGMLTIAVATGNATRELVVLAAAGIGVGISVGIPVMQALIPTLVPHEEMGDAIRLNALTFNVARVLGPTLAALVLGTLGPAWAFGINAVSFAAIVAALTMIGRVPYPRVADRSPGPIREGIAYAWRHLRTRWMLLSIVAIGIALDPIVTLAPAISARLGVAGGGAGYVVGSWGAGAVVTILVGRRLIVVATERGLGWIALVVLFAGVSIVGLAPAFPVVLLGGLVAGGGYIVATMAFTTVIQADVPESLRGRVSALWSLAFLGPRAFASVGVGALADAAGTRVSSLSFAVVALGAAVLLRHVSPPHAEPVSPPA
ncbi:MAG TPA: MFS transporter [Actinomycetota bacterium]